MKRNTLIWLLGAIVLGVVVYVLEIREGKPRDEKSDATKPAFSFKREEIASIKVIRTGQAVRVEDRGGNWVVAEPVKAPADQATANSIASSLTGARIERSLSASTDEAKSYGLDEPAVTVEVTLKNGEQHRVQLGGKDFSGLSVYSRLDDTGNVVLLPASVLTSADKSLDQLRDRSVLGLAQFDISSLVLENESGQTVITKEGTDWKIKKPFEADADPTEMSAWLGQLTSAKVEEFVGEAAGDLAKYGLDKPKLSLKAKLQDGSERVVAIGSKTGESYYAKNSDRPQVVKVESILYDRLNIKPFELRDRQIVKLNREELTRVEIKNPNGTLIAEKDKDGKWIIKEPADKKEKEAQMSKIFSSIEQKAMEILDQPPASARPKLAKPAVEVQVTDRSGKTTVLSLSSADGDNAYISVKGRPGIYKVRKQVVEDLSFKPADMAQ
jgi:uncharacterized protein DUF4340